MKENLSDKKDLKKEISRRDFLRMASGFSIVPLVLKSEAGEVSKTPEGPFNPEVQKEVLEAVAKEMKIVLNSKLPLPVVIVAEQVPDEEYNRICGV